MAEEPIGPFTRYLTGVVRRHYRAREHLPGRHSQKLHAPKKWRRGGWIPPVTTGQPLTQDDVDRAQSLIHDLVPPPAPGRQYTSEDWAVIRKLEDDPDFQKLAKTLKGTVPDAVSHLKGAWTATSGDHSPTSVGLQLAIQQEFGLEDSATSHLDRGTVKNAFRHFGSDLAGLRKYARAQYEVTQDILKKAGVEEVPLFRGMGFKRIPQGLRSDQFIGTRQRLDVAMQPLSSFSLRLKTAGSFAGLAQYGLILAGRVPRERVFSLGGRGLGATREYEVTVLGGKQNMWGVGWKSGQRPGDYAEILTGGE